MVVSFLIVAFLVVKLKILNGFRIDSASWGVFALPSPSAPPPPKKRKLSDFTKKFPKCRIKIQKSSVLRIFERFKFLQRQGSYTQSLYFWSVFDTPASPQLKMAEIENNNYFQRKTIVIKFSSLLSFLGSRCILNLVRNQLALISNPKNEN